MSLIQAVVLGIVQGLTEFLPISSDGHLALVYAAFGEKPVLSYEVLLHGATLLAITEVIQSSKKPSPAFIITGCHFRRVLEKMKAKEGSSRAQSRRKKKGL